MTPAALPTGRRGQALAVAILLIALAVVGVGAVAPVLGWYQARQDQLQDRRALASRMAALAATAPALQRAMEAVGAEGPARRTTFDAPSDAVAGAALQQDVQDLVGSASATMASAEALPSEPAGPLRRIGVRVTVSGTWPVLVGLLTAIDEAAPRMLVGDLQLQPTQSLVTGPARPLDATFTVSAFHNASAPQDGAGAAQ
jgi:general secretion pathway protein M